LALVLALGNPAAADEVTDNNVNAADGRHEGPLAIKIYQKYISGIGDRCSMYPSCSHYSSQAIQKHGWLKGWIMSCDRLMRCGRDEVNLSDPIMVNGRPHIYDPVSRNDIWKSNTSWNPLSSNVP
jgi:putative component of membrane protein insertase Oxa1/YidC/SpoIIIJ protein YidD